MCSFLEVSGKELKVISQVQWLMTMESRLLRGSQLEIKQGKIRKTPYQPMDGQGSTHLSSQPGRKAQIRGIVVQVCLSIKQDLISKTTNGNKTIKGLDVWLKWEKQLTDTGGLHL
jgi:hypothetical protein